MGESPFLIKIDEIFIYLCYYKQRNNIGEIRMFKILVVEDNANVRRLMQVVLKQNGFEPILAENAMKALSIEGTSGSPYAYSRYYDAGYGRL